MTVLQVPVFKRTNATGENPTQREFTQLGLDLEAMFRRMAQYTNDRATLEQVSGVINVKQYGAKGDGRTDDTTAWAVAMAAAGAASVDVLAVGNFKLTSTINIPSGVTLRLIGSIIAGTQATILSLNGASNAGVDGGTIIGDGATDGQSGIELHDATRCVVKRVYVRSCLNKGINLWGATTDCTIEPLQVTGSTGTYGVGLSMYGANVLRNTVRGGYYTANRAGISLNGGGYHKVVDVDASGNTIAGLFLDGVVTNSGDGAKYCEVLGGTFNNNGPTASFAGVYFGNGASFNKIIGVTANGNAGAGIRGAGVIGVNQNDGNLILGCNLEGNATKGLAISGSPDARIIGTRALTNTSHGFQIFTSDRTMMSGCDAASNTDRGIMVQSASVYVSACRSTGNAIGYEVAYGGTAAPTGNLVTVSSVTGNTTNFTIPAGLGRVDSTDGIPATTYSQGDASYVWTPPSPYHVLEVSVAMTAARTTQLNHLDGGGNVVARPGDRIRVRRTAAATGAYALTVTAQTLGTLILLTPNSWCEAIFDGTTWVLSAFGYGYKRQVGVAFSASMTINASLSDAFTIAANSNANVTINAPTNATIGQEMTLTIYNTSGGALGTITWNAIFKMAAWTSPATGFNQSIRFIYDGTNWREITRTTLDVPN